MLGLASVSLLALILSPSALADSHLRNRRRQHEERKVDVFEGPGSSEGHVLAKRAFTGRGTFYYTGLGACGIYNGNNDHIVALNSAQYHLHGSGYPGPECFKTLTIQSNGVTVSGVQVTDECPTCDWGGLDLSPGLFDLFHSANGGTLDLTWWWEDGSSDPTTSTQQPTSTTPAWTPTSTSTWSPDPTPTSTSTWSPPPSSSSTWTPPPSSTSTWVAPSSSSVSSAVVSSSASNSTNPFAIIHTDNSTSTSLSLSASASASITASPSSGSGAAGTPAASTAGNLVAINGLVASYGQLIVVGAGGHQ